MSKIEFKKLPKDIKEEGITIELLEKVQESGKISPVMFQKGDEPVELVKCSDGFYWVLLDDGKYLRDEKKQLLKFDLKTCIIARARYWLLYSNQEMEMDEKRREAAKEKEIQKEVQRIKNDLKKQVKEINSKYDDICRYAGIQKEGLNNLLTQLENEFNPEKFEIKKELALKILSENTHLENSINELNKDLQEENFDSLYIKLKTGGLPLIASFDYSDSGMELMKRFFHREKIESTIEMIKDKSYIESVAIFNVNKRYA